MKNKKGFTLIELLAVIAILALLVVFAVPNVLKLFTDSKKSAFVTQAQSVYKSAEEQIISRQLSNPTASIKRFYSDSGIDKLKLTGTEDVKYCIKVVGNKITSFAIVDGKHYFYKNDISSVSDITGEDNDSYGDGYKILSCDSNGNATLLDVHLTLTGENIIDISSLAVGGSVEKTFSVKNETSSTSYYDIKMSNVYTTFVGDNLVYTLSSTNGGGTKTETIMPNNDGLIKAKISIAGNTTQTYTMTITNKNTGVHPEDYNAGATYTGKIVILTPYTYTNGNADNIELSNRIMLDNTEAPNSNTSSKYVTASSGINYANPSDYAYDGYYTYTETVNLTSSSNKQIGTTFSYDGTSGLFTVTGTKVSSKSYSSDYIGQYTCYWINSPTCYASPWGLYKILEVDGTTVTKAERYMPKPKKDTWNGLGLYSTSTNTMNNGTTYFFRGHVVNNYVSFAGDLWRIVRINEDESIRMIRQLNYVSAKFNTSNNDPMYAGYMFGTSSDPYANTNPSNVKTQLEAYYDSKLASLSSYLAPIEFCNDRTIDSTSGATIYYGAYRRHASSAPTFTCPNEERDLFTMTTSSRGNKKLTKSIGLITADEAMYAGTKYGKFSWTYLYNGTTGGYWTASPYYYYSSASRNYYSLPGGILTNNVVTSGYGIRPVISLKSDVLVSGGSGSANDPYVIAQ